MTQGSTKPMIITVLSVALVFGAIYGFQQFRNGMIQKAIRGQGMPPQTVSTLTAQTTSWQPVLSTIGSLHPVLGANLSTESGGLVTAIHFKSGDHVPAGKILVELNAAPQIAQLNQFKANERLAHINYDRDSAQFKIQAVSQAILDSDAAAVQSAQAQIAAQRANIEQKIIRAPFAGRLGIRQVDPGQYVAPGATVVSLQTLDPIYVDFTVPQSELSDLHPGLAITAQTDALPGTTITGKITAIEPQVDTNTRNIKVRATLPNHDGKLMPGLFMNLKIIQGKPQNWITLPDTAVAYNPYGSTVFIVHSSGNGANVHSSGNGANGKPRLTVEQRIVTTGDTRGDQVAILRGIQPGEVIVTSGQLKLHRDAPVLINNDIQPLNNPNPEVHDE